MGTIQTGTYRELTSYLRNRLSLRTVRGLSASGQIDDELWILLEYYSEVEEVGLTYLQNNGITNNQSRKKTFQDLPRVCKTGKKLLLLR